MTETELARRLERLERDNQRLNGFAVAALVLAMAFGAIYATQPTPQTITAHQFEVVDESGRARVAIDTMYGPNIRLLDAHGNQRVVLAFDETGAGVGSAHARDRNRRQALRE